MTRCPLCQTEVDSALEGRLCMKCSARVLAQDRYTPSDLRFVGVLAGVLTAAVLSMPGALIGHLIGRSLDQASRGCLIGVIVFSLMGLAAGFFIGPALVRRAEAFKQT